MKRPGLAATLLLLMLTAACGGNGAPAMLTADGVSRKQPAADAPVASVAGAVTALGYQLTTTAFPQGHNAVVSPLSIEYAFAMARAGAGGETAAQLDRVLGFPATGLHDAFNAITRQVVTAALPPAKPRRTGAAEPQPPVVCVGNGLFIQHGLAVGAPFLHTLAAQYGAGVRPVDFSTDDGVKTIDAWARQQTAGRIKKVFDSLDPSTRLVLANTVYLRADWPRDLFAKEAVTTEPFTRLAGGPVRVPTMHADAELRYAAGPGWQAVEVPYAKGDLAMRILLPAPGRAAGPLLAPATMAAVATALQPVPVGLSLPRWDFATDLDLVPALKALGLTAPFSADADFSGISPDLHVSKAIHRANITVDEWGTEAAAVTGLAFDSAGVSPPKIQLTVDHPFAFAVVHTGTGVPLFMGQVTDPSAH